MPPPSPEPLRALDSELELGERLGSGAMGSVYRARERSSGREVALKVLHAETASAATRFLREGQITAQLQHPGIVRVHSLGTLRGRPCLCYELVPGARSFEEAVAAEPGLAIPLLLQAGAALGAAHAIGLVHRDVKSENLLVDAAGRLRVTDFGLVTGEELGRLTQSGALVGTPMTMAPEQFGARHQIGPATDVWALGVLLYRALTGVYPFQGAENLVSLASAIAAGDFPKPSSVRPTPLALEVVCLRALRVEPSQRYPNGGAFAAALQLALSSPEPSVTRGRLALRAFGLVAAGLGAAALILGGVLAEATPTPPGSPPRPSQALRGGTPSAPSPTPPSPTPSPTPPSPLADLLSWRLLNKSHPLPPELLKRDYAQANPSFQFLFSSLKRQSSVSTQLRVARALLRGNVVERDLELGLEFLRQAAARNEPEAYVSLIETLAAEGRPAEELVWLGRRTLHRPLPYALHRLWRIARDPKDPRRPLAEQIWRATPPQGVRWALMDWLDDVRAYPTHQIRADQGERNEFAIEAALHGWRGQPGLESDWQLGAILDLMPAATQLRLIQAGAPSRRLARLCLRREARVHETIQPADLPLLQAALEPTLVAADEAWAIEVVRRLLEGGAEPPCLGDFLRLLRSMDTPKARRWFPLAQARGFGVPANPAGARALLRLHEQGDQEVALLLVGSPQAPLATPNALSLLTPGVNAGHAGSMYLKAKILVRESASPSERRDAREFLERAAAAGYAPAQSLLARFLEASLQGPADLARAHSLSARAAKADDLDALKRLAVYQHQGFGCPRNAIKAMWTAARAARLGDREAGLRVGTWLLAARAGESGDEALTRRARGRRYLRRAKLCGLDKEAELLLLRSDLQDPARVAPTIKRLRVLAAAEPLGPAAVELGKVLSAQGEAEGELILRRLAPRWSTALDAYAGRLRAEAREAELEAFLEAGVQEQNPICLLFAGREGFTKDPAWGEQTLLRAARQGRPQAYVVLGQCLWDTRRPDPRRRAWGFWLRALAASNEQALEKLGAHEWPQ